MPDMVLVAREGRVATVTLNRPAAFNAFDEGLVCSLAECMAELAADDSVHAVILTGAGKAFCAGGDLKAAGAAAEGPGRAFHRLAGRFHAAVTEMRRMPKPVIAAVNGVAAGGGFSLALAADFRILAESAVLRCSYTSWGLCVDGGGTWTLPRLVGHHRALEIAVFDEPISAPRALELGLVTKVVTDGSVLDEARAMAEDLLRRSRHSFAWTKRLLLQAFDTPLERHLEDERAGIAACGAHPDGLEGLAAFAQKRKPVFNAR